MAIRDFLITIIPTVRIISHTLQALDTDDTGFEDEAGKQGLAFANAAETYIDSFPQGSRAAKGYNAIKAFTDNVKNSFALVVESTAPKAQKIAQAQILADSLTDDNLVYPAKKGKDGELLQKTIREINEKLAALKGA